STASRSSSHKDGSQASVHQKTRKQMIIEKLREQLFKAKAFLINRSFKVRVQKSSRTLKQEVLQMNNICSAPWRFLEIYLPMKQFFYNLIHPEYSAVTDVYVLMFLADTVDFIIIVRFSENTVAQMWYFVKCIYFGLSAYQIRCGYPTRVLGNFLTKSYNYVNLFLFQG
ncbi:hypothetical protein XENOCAPTIV_010988, partial [Xenoophorus captivus]